LGTQVHEGVLGKGFQTEGLEQPHENEVKVLLSTRQVQCAWKNAQKWIWCNPSKLAEVEVLRFLGKGLQVESDKKITKY
jgi:hypothetical protein